MKKESKWRLVKLKHQAFKYSVVEQLIVLWSDTKLRARNSPYNTLPFKVQPYFNTSEVSYNAYNHYTPQ